MVLESDDAETVLYLRQGAGVTSGSSIGFNDGESAHNYRRATISETLGAGTYTIEATTYAAGEYRHLHPDRQRGGRSYWSRPGPRPRWLRSGGITADGTPVMGTWGDDFACPT